MATKPKKTGTGRRKKTDAATGVNFLLVGSDGKLFLKSGLTGKIRALTAGERSKVASLLRDRQQSAVELTKLLESADFPLSDTLIVDQP